MIKGRSQLAMIFRADNVPVVCFCSGRCRRPCLELGACLIDGRSCCRRGHRWASWADSRGTNMLPGWHTTFQGHQVFIIVLNIVTGNNHAFIELSWHLIHCCLCEVYFLAVFLIGCVYCPKFCRALRTLKCFIGIKGNWYAHVQFFPHKCLDKYCIKITFKPLPPTLFLRNKIITHSYWFDYENVFSVFVF